MDADYEKNLLGGLAKLQKDVKLLKSSHKKLSDKVDNVEIQGFHDQIQALNKRIDELQSSILDTQQTLAYLHVNYDWLHMQQALHNKPIYQRAREHLLVEVTKAMESIGTSPSPLKVALDFKRICIDYSKKHNLEAFREDSD